MIQKTIFSVTMIGCLLSSIGAVETALRSDLNSQEVKSNTVTKSISVDLNSLPPVINNAERYRYKLSINIVNTVTFGDLNFNYEMPVYSDSAFLIGAHLNPDKFNYAYTGNYGGVLAYKLYLKNGSSDGLFSMALIGYNHAYDNTKFTDLLSLEFWAGNTWIFGKNIFVDLGIGLGRKYDPNEKSEPSILAGANFGFYFPEKVFFLF